MLAVECRFICDYCL